MTGSPYLDRRVRPLHEVRLAKGGTITPPKPLRSGFREAWRIFRDKPFEVTGLAILLVIGFAVLWAMAKLLGA